MPAPTALAIETFVLLLILGMIGFVIYRKNDFKKIQLTWVNYKVTDGESITKIAKRYNVSWKKLAKVNDIKPPYQLSSGDTIKVPPKNRANKL